jgi:putative transcriptional regulator
MVVVCNESLEERHASPQLHTLTGKGTVRRESSRGGRRVTHIRLKNQIRRLRFEHGEMSQKELARRAGCTRQTINAIEASKYGPSLELAFRIARVFGVGIEEVFQSEDLETEA